jgi:FlaA1/EpsC-like NDP-sugar epimerase
MIRLWRSTLAFAHDLMATALAWLLAFWLRFNFETPPSNYIDIALTSLLFVCAVYSALFLVFGLYRGMWRYASLSDFKRIITTVGIGALAAPALMVMLQLSVPRTVFIVSPFFIMMLMGGSRLAYRAWREGRIQKLLSPDRTPVLVVGADIAAAGLIKELARSPQWRVVGSIDDDGAKHGRQLHGVTVLGPVTEIKKWKETLQVQHAIIAMPDASHVLRRRAVDQCQEAGLEVLTVPSYEDLISGRVTVSQVRHVELDDLLGRDPVVLDTQGLSAWLADRVVMITGAGGSIGSELCRQVAKFGPRKLILYEISEFALYSMSEELTGRLHGVEITCAIGDVRDRRRVTQIMRDHRPSVVFHAAAYKHVPLMEQHNASQAVANNVRGTYVVAEASIAADVEKFVLISTDKSVNPTNVMGATKRLAEMTCQALQRADGTRFVIVRFGNVLGSTGSVIPKFKEQIAKGGPVTVTHPDITRYFMSIPEAAQLVLQAGLMGRRAEIYVLDMGEPVRIAELAHDMIRLSGFTEQEIRIQYTGLRPGEKLFEELLGAEESSLPTPHSKLRVARSRSHDHSWLSELNPWLDRAETMGDADVKAELARQVREYTPR